MKGQLEGLIDQHTLGVVVETLRAVCHDKADHLRSNWQDEASAKMWERCAQALDRAHVTIGATLT